MSAAPASRSARQVTNDEAAAYIRFLSSENASYPTGTTMDINASYMH